MLVNGELIYKQKPKIAVNVSGLHQKITQEEMEKVDDDLDNIEDVPEPTMQKSMSEIMRQKRIEAEKIEKQIKENEKPAHQVYQVSKKYAFTFRIRG